jgi:CHAT domain-containing protein
MTKRKRSDGKTVIEGIQAETVRADVMAVGRGAMASKVVMGSEVDTRVPILFLAADPTDASRLRLGEELREIQEKLQLARLRERFSLHQRMSVRPADLSQALLDTQPQVVHFSGHGTASGELCFENVSGKAQPIAPDALAALFEQFADQVDCVVLNACYSEAQAKAIARHIGHVIGMNRAIGDRAAIAFAVGFYQALGAGRTVEEAYRLGCVQIRLQGISEHLTPVLLKKEQA